MEARLANADQSRMKAADYYSMVKQDMEGRDKSMITDMFQGIVGDCILCQSCKKPKFKYDTEMMLSLPLGDAASQQRSISRRSANRANSMQA